MSIRWRRKAQTEPLPTQQTPYGVAILLELNRSKHIYEGTVAPAEKARRRATNKVARRSRRINRGQR